MKITKRKVINFILFMTLVFSENAISAEVLSVEEAVNLARKNNISIERNEITLNALKRADSHSWNSVSPSISFSVNSSVPIDFLSDKESDYAVSTGISATLSLNLTANLYTQIQSAKYNYEIGKINFDDALKNVEFSVRQAFYGLLYEKENIALQEKNMNLAKQQYNTNLQKYNAGRLSEIDLLSSEVSYKEKIPTLENARTLYENDLASFKQLLGIEMESEIELDGDLDSLVYLKEISIEKIEPRSSNIQILEKRVEAAKNSLLDKRFSAYAPTISARASFDDKSWYIGKESNPNKSTTLSLSATIPIDGCFPWSSKHDGVESAKDSLKDYELQLENAKTSLKLSIDSLLRSIRQSQISIQSKQSNVKLAQRRYNMTYDAYSRGTKDLLTLQNADSSLLSAQLSLKNEIYNFVKNVMNLEKTLGVEFGTLMAD